MATLIYDNTFPGFLTAVFEVYEYRYANAAIVPQSRPQSTLFGEYRVVESNNEKAVRVWHGLAKHIPATDRQDIYRVFLSEQPDVEAMLLQYIQQVFISGNISKNYSMPSVMYIADIVRKVRREKTSYGSICSFQANGR